jgi:hypothetical protein
LCGLRLLAVSVPEDPVDAEVYEIYYKRRAWVFLAMLFVFVIAQKQYVLF